MATLMLETSLIEDKYDPANFFFDVLTNERVSKYTGYRCPRALSPFELIERKRIGFATDDCYEHFINVLVFATENKAYDAFVRALNYLAPHDDAVTMMFRDGRSNEMSFFWQNITQAEYAEARAKQASNYGGRFMMPDRRTYHGGLIWHSRSHPIEWSVHT